MTPHERAAAEIEAAPINADGSTRCLICQGTTSNHRTLTAAGVEIPCPHDDVDDVPVPTYRPSFLVGGSLSNPVRVRLLLAMAGIDEADLHSSHSNPLARLDGRQLDVVELIVAAAVQNTSRVFLESAAAHELVDPAAGCVCADEPAGVCLGVPGESDACGPCLERDPEAPCLADVEAQP